MAWPPTSRCAVPPCRFPAPTPGSRSGKRVALVREIERQASEAWRATPCEVPAGEAEGTAFVAEVAEAVVEERNAVAAYDFLTVQIPLQSDGQGGDGNKVASRRQPATRNNNHAKRRRKAQGPHTGDAIRESTR